ncbi:MAG: hypothetical protein V4543_05910 [Bacteroidota bacterium]
MSSKIFQYTCPSCSSELDYDPASKGLKCRSCGYKEAIAVTEGEAHLAENSYGEVEQENAYQTVGVTCAKCAAEFQMPDYTLSVDCPYCGSNTVVDFAARTHSLKPDAIVPFAIAREQMTDIVKKAVGSNPFVPAEAKKYMISGGIKGIYVPSYSFDFIAETEYEGKRGTKYTKTDSKGNKTEEIRWTNVSGQVDVKLDDLQFVSGKYAALIEIEENQNKAMVPFEEKYLTGFLAEGHSVPLAKCFDNAKSLAVDEIEDAIETDIGGDEQQIDKWNAEYKNVKYRHFLYPFWVGDYAYNGKNFLFLISGMNGSAQIKVPISGWKVFFYFIAITLLSWLSFKIIGSMEGYGSIADWRARATGWHTAIPIIWNVICWLIFGFGVPSTYGVFTGTDTSGKQTLAEIDNETFAKLSEVKNIDKKAGQTNKV